MQCQLLVSSIARSSLSPCVSLCVHTVHCAMVRFVCVCVLVCEREKTTFSSHKTLYRVYRTRRIDYTMQDVNDLHCWTSKRTLLLNKETIGPPVCTRDLLAIHTTHVPPIYSYTNTGCERSTHTCIESYSRIPWQALVGRFMHLYACTVQHAQVR